MARLNKQSIFLMTALLLTAVLLAACEPGDPGRSTGAYPIEIFPEMHYQDSFKAQEGPRLLPPAGSIPVSGSSLPVGNKAEERDTPNPLEPTAETVEYGALLFQRDCSMCHGDMGGGDGQVGLRLIEYSGVQPPELDSERMQALTPGEKFASISNGAGLMPPFGSLLTAEQRWSIITMIEASAAERQAALQEAASLTPEDRTLRLLELRDR